MRWPSRFVCAKSRREPIINSDRLWPSLPIKRLPIPAGVDIATARKAPISPQIPHKLKSPRDLEPMLFLLDHFEAARQLERWMGD